METTPYYHGNLSAKNVLVGEGLTVKISDFALAGDRHTHLYERIGQAAREKTRSVKWISVETIRGDPWTIRSDM